MLSLCIQCPVLVMWKTPFMHDGCSGRVSTCKCVEEDFISLTEKIEPLFHAEFIKNIRNWMLSMSENSNICQKLCQRHTVYLSFNPKHIMYSTKESFNSFFFFHSTSEYEPVPPANHSLIEQQTSQSCWVLGESSTDVRHHLRAAAASAETLHRRIQTSSGHASKKAYQSAMSLCAIPVSDGNKWQLWMWAMSQHTSPDDTGCC